MNETIRTYWFVEERTEDGNTLKVSGYCNDKKTAQKKARYHRNQTGKMTYVIEVEVKTTVTKSYKVVNNYEPKQNE